MSTAPGSQELSALTPREMAQFFFGRPTEPPFDWIRLDEQRLCVIGDVSQFFGTLTEFFESFVELAEPYEFKQVEQGIQGLSPWCGFSLGGAMNHWGIRTSRS